MAHAAQGRKARANLFRKIVWHKDSGHTRVLRMRTAQWSISDCRLANKNKRNRYGSAYAPPLGIGECLPNHNQNIKDWRIQLFKDSTAEPRTPLLHAVFRRSVAFLTEALARLTACIGDSIARGAMRGSRRHRSAACCAVGTTGVRVRK